MTTTVFSKAWAIMILALVVFSSMFVGMDLADGDWQGAIINGILLTFWIFAAIWYHAMALRERKLDLEFEESTKKLDDVMGDLLGHLKEEHERKERVHDAMHAALESIGEDRPPKPSEYKKVQDVFHEKSGGLYLQLTATKGDKRPAAEVSDTPFPAVKNKKAPARKPVAKKGATNAKTSTRK